MPALTAPPLRYKGGHLGYGVRPSRRRRGYATLMLRLSLPVANQLVSRF